jgi:hypothetical protein
MSVLTITPPPEVSEGTGVKADLYSWLYSVYVRIKNGVRFDANKDGTNQSIADNTTTTVSFSNLTADTVGGYDTSTNIYTSQIPGPYHVTVKVTLSHTLLVANTFTLKLFKNGAVYESRTINGSTAVNPDILISRTIPLSIGETLKVQILQVTGGARNISGATTDTFFQAYRIN